MTDIRTAALAARTMVGRVAPMPALLEAGQGQPGPARWTTSPDDTGISGGCYPYRNPANRFALPPDRLARA
ncbi:hypothetical protein GCM10017668_69570 [Streptomyces tuirus]|uniref:Uncharacterized protein n=1 Tax=Streptomyces tuirus TaxID=68278 RepID=A0A7G1NTZ6_9ACTN|nr:hypothetical protein GCM10017668_00280 [Streptomyces tuirus]BCL25114.1 hypothetical protein GCM10017668_69570 [Streptomyces tuirus]